MRARCNRVITTKDQKVLETFEAGAQMGVPGPGDGVRVCTTRGCRRVDRPGIGGLGRLLRWGACVNWFDSSVQYRVDRFHVI